MAWQDQQLLDLAGEFEMVIFCRTLFPELIAELSIYL